VIEEDKQLIVEAVDVEQKDGLGVNFERMPGENLEEFFEGAEATRERDEGVGFFSDERLAGVHGARDVEFRDAIVGDLKIDEHLGDDANDLSVKGQGCLRNSPHETHIGSAIDEANVAIGERVAKFLGSGTVDGTGSVGGGAKNGNATNHRDEDIKYGIET
jgi:hypothetical protein